MKIFKASEIVWRIGWELERSKHYQSFEGRLVMEYVHYLETKFSERRYVLCEKDFTKIKPKDEFNIDIWLRG